MSHNRPALSACIITFNEEENIKDCLESLFFCDEIVVVDAQSTDRTVEICRGYTQKVVQRPWPGHIEQKNFALSSAQGPWVLCVDADERVSPELRKEILTCLKEESLNWDGFYLPRHTFYLGRWINYSGWYPDYQLRLFRKDKGHWAGVNPHDKVHITGRVRHLKSDLWHFSYKDISHNLRTVNNFTSIAAQQKKAQGERFSLLTLLIHPPARFIKTFFLKRAYKDGIPGLIIAVTSSFYVFLKYAKLWELSHAHKGAEET